MKLSFFKKPGSRSRRESERWGRGSKLKLQIRKPDWLVLTITLVLVFFGLLAIFDASSVIAQRDFGNRFYYLQNQAIWAVLGLAALALFSFVDYHRLAKLSLIGLIIVIALLIITLFPHTGPEVLGAKRRFSAGGITIQPSELAKLIYLLYLSFRFSQFSKKIFSFWQFLATTVFILALIVLEPDLGTAIIIGSLSFLIYFLAGAPIKNFIIIFLLFIAAVVGLIFSAEYRLTRLLSFLNLAGDTQGIAYHQNQILVGLGVGGLTGTGFGSSLQKFYYLPEAPTDSIFAVIAEEFGFIGATILIFIFFVLLWRGIQIARAAPDDLGQLIAAGIVFLIGLQVIINLAGQVALFPLTGVPLPFISYGGSSLITLMAAVGILVNISKQRVTSK